MLVKKFQNTYSECARLICLFKLNVPVIGFPQYGQFLAGRLIFGLILFFSCCFWTEFEKNEKIDSLVKKYKNDFGRKIVFNHLIW